VRFLFLEKESFFVRYFVMRVAIKNVGVGEFTGAKCASTVLTSSKARHERDNALPENTRVLGMPINQFRSEHPFCPLSIASLPRELPAGYTVETYLESLIAAQSMTYVWFE
jgi:hypothetical protein